MGMANVDFVTRTTGCPNGCARPYMAEIAFVGSGPGTYQLWLGGSPAQTRTGWATDIFKMKYADLEATLEPIFAMYKTQRNAADEAVGDFCHRLGWAAIEAFMGSYTAGSHATMIDPFATPLLAADASVGIDAKLLETVSAEAAARGLDAPTLLDMIAREALLVG